MLFWHVRDVGSRLHWRNLCRIVGKFTTVALKTTRKCSPLSFRRLIIYYHVKIWTLVNVGFAGQKSYVLVTVVVSTCYCRREYLLLSSWVLVTVICEYLLLLSVSTCYCRRECLLLSPWVLVTVVVNTCYCYLWVLVTVICEYLLLSSWVLLTVVMSTCYCRREYLLLSSWVSEQP